MKTMNIEFWTVMLVLGYAVLLTILCKSKIKAETLKMETEKMNFINEKGKEYDDMKRDLATRSMDGFIHLDFVDSLVDKYRIRNKYVVLAQMRLETGNFNSYLCRWYNNITGMKYPLVRPHVACDKISESGYAVYASLEDCVADYAIYQSRIRQKDMSDEEYIQLLIDSGYSQDANYALKIRAIIESEQVQQLRTFRDEQKPMFQERGAYNYNKGETRLMRESK